MTKEKINEVKEKVAFSNKEMIAVSKAVKEQAVSMNEIEVGTQNLANSSTDIESKSMDQTEIIEKSIEVLRVISEIVEKNTASTEETTFSAYELLNIAKKLNEAVNKFKV